MSSKRYIDEVASTYKGHDFFVKLQRLGHRCGYVRVNDSTLFSKIQNWYNWWNNQDFDFDVHGGITFVNQSTGDNYLLGMNWIGFDCVHCAADCPDREATLLGTNIQPPLLCLVTNIAYMIQMSSTVS